MDNYAHLDIISHPQSLKNKSCGIDFCEVLLIKKSLYLLLLNNPPPLSFENFSLKKGGGLLSPKVPLCFSPIFYMFAKYSCVLGIVNNLTSHYPLHWSHFFYGVWFSYSDYLFSMWSFPLIFFPSVSKRN